LAWKFLLRDTFQGFQAPLWDFGSRAADLGNYWQLRTGSREDLITAYRDASRLASGHKVLSDQPNQLSDERKRLLALKIELNRLRKELGISGPTHFQPIVARVTKRELNAWWQRLHLRKGELQGINKGDGVIFEGGIVGRVVETAKRSCVVQLATSPYFRIAANFRGDDRPVTFQGGGNHNFSSPFGKVKDAPTDISPTSTNPMQLVTSPLSDFFPAGIIIGETKDLQTDPNGLFRTGRIDMDDRLLTLREVTVLISPYRAKMQ
jgi:rod shape-determining protein MreC